MRIAAETWLDAYPAAHRAKAERNRNRRQRRREAAARREAGQRRRPVVGPLPDPDEVARKAELRDRARNCARSRRALEALRLRRGYVGIGGAIGGNPAYLRRAVTYRGLVSDEHPILKLFVAKVPRARNLLVGDDKARVSRTDSKLLGLDAAYIVANTKMRGVLRVELDRVFPGGIMELAAVVMACGVALPNIVVGYIDPTGRLHHPHLLWLLDESVPFVGQGRQKPRGLWKGTLAGLTAALLPIGADPGGLTNAMRMKNPLSPEWDRAVLAGTPYTLAPDPRPGAAGFAALAPRLDPARTRALLREASEARQGRHPVADHPDPAVAGQSNGLFRYLRELARERVGWHRLYGSESEFCAELAAAALRVAPDGRAGERAAIWTAENVAAWTWANYHPRPARAPRCATSKARRERQAAGQAKGAATRSGATVAVLVDAIRRIAATGREPTQVAVIATKVRGRRTVQRHWDAALAAAKKGAIQVAIDKKGAAFVAGGASSVGAVPEIHGAPLPPTPSMGAEAGGLPGGASGAAGAPSPPCRVTPCRHGVLLPLPFLMPAPKGTAGGVATAARKGRRGAGPPGTIPVPCCVGPDVILPALARAAPGGGPWPGARRRGAEGRGGTAGRNVVGGAEPLSR